MIKNKNIDPNAAIDPTKIVGGFNGAPLRPDAKYLFVSSVKGSNSNSGRDVNHAKASINGALAAATASVGDIIYLLPGHAETVADATTVNLSVAGVSIVGIGQGSLRPTLTFTTANTANVTLSAKNVSLSNIIMIGNFLSIASAITMTGTADCSDFSMDNVVFRDVDSTHGFLSILTTNSTANKADGLKITNCRVSSDSTSAGPMVVMLCTNNRVQLNDNYIVHTGANNNVAIVMNSGSLVSSNLQIARNQIFSTNTDSATGGYILVTSSTTSTGMVHDNYVKGLDVAAAVMITATGSKLGEFNNLYTGDVDTSGYVMPAIGSTS